MSFQDTYKQAIDKHKAGDLAGADRLLEYLGSMQPNDPFVLFALGNLDYELGRKTRAIQMLERVCQIKPEWHDAWTNLGVFYRRTGHTKKAIENYEKAYTLDPKSEHCLSNLAGAYINEGAPEVALKWADECLKSFPQSNSAVHQKALALMELGRWKEGFGLYDARLNTPEHLPFARKYPYPRWDGKRVKRLLIHGEQGLGDEILFTGWVSRAKALCDELVIEATDRLVNVFKRSFDCEVYPTPDMVMEAGPCDAYIPMGSLPQVFDIADRDMAGYIKPDPDKVAYLRKRLEAIGPGPYIGFSWMGGTTATHAHLRASPIECWKPLVKYGTPISIQYGDTGDPVAKVFGMQHWDYIVNHPERLINLIAACDLIVTVNNTAVHMAGALGKPCFVLTPSKPAWRYQLHGESMPWYSSARQFRQFAGDWKPAFNKVEAAIADYTGVSGNQSKAA